MKRIVNNDIGVSVVKIFRILSSPIRLRMLLLLGQKEYCACEFPSLLHISQPLASRNLSILKEAGLISSTPDGQFNIYRLKMKKVLSLIKMTKEIKI
jgi:ArsR family transcriptional regulator